MSDRKIMNGVLCYPIKKNRILLGRKERGLGMGLWNGFGGKVQKEESILEAAIRELEEECNLVVSQTQLEQVAFLRFHYANDVWQVHIFFAREWEREPQATEEMGQPTWFGHSELPYEQMWADDQEWMPRVLRGEKIEGDVHFKDGGIAIERSNYKKVSHF